MPWSRERLPTPVFWPGEIHGLYSPWGRRLGHNWVTFTYPLSWWCHPTIISSATHFSTWPSIFPRISIISSESALHIRWPKYQGFSFSSNPLNDYSGLISFRTDCTRDSQESSAEKEVATNSMDSIQLYLFPIMIISSFLQLYHNLLFLPCCIG